MKRKEGGGLLGMERENICKKVCSTCVEIENIGIDELNRSKHRQRPAILRFLSSHFFQLLDDAPLGWDARRVMTATCVTSCLL